jgi:hypothetical protein
MLLYEHSVENIKETSFYCVAIKQMFSEFSDADFYSLPNKSKGNT